MQPPAEKNDADTFIGLKSTNPGTLYTEEYNSQQCLLQREALGLVETSQSNGIPRNGEEGCCMTISTYILPSTLFKPSGQMNFKVFGLPLLSPDLAP